MESLPRDAIFSDFDIESPISKAVAEAMRPKEGGGMSFLSRFSKTVSTKRKYGKSFKGHALPAGERKISDVDVAFRESLESIVEGGAEKTSDKRGSCQRTFSMGADGGEDGLEGAFAPPDRRAVAEKDRISVRDLVRSFVVKDTGNGPVVTQARGEKPSPSPRLSKPKSPPLPQNRRLQEHRPSTSHNSDASVAQTLHNGRVSSGIPQQDQSQTHSRSSSGSFYNMWPQFFSSNTATKSQTDKDKLSSSKKLPSKHEDPSGAVRQRSHTFTVSKSASSADGKRSPGGASPAQPAASGGRTSPRRLPQIPRQEVSKASPRLPGRNSNQHWPPAAVRNSSPHLAEFSRPLAVQASAMAQSNGALSDCMKASTPPPKRSKFLSTFGFGTDSSAKKGDSDKVSTKTAKNSKGRNSDEWNVVYTNSPGGPSSRIKRIGAMRKGEEAERVQEGLGQASIQSDPEKTPNFPSREHNPGKNVTAGAIPKSSYLNKTFHIMNKDECKRSEVKHSDTEDAASEREAQQGSQAAARSPAKSARKLGKRVLERSISVPFWTKFSGQETVNGQSADSEDDLPALEAGSQSERPPAGDSKEEMTKPKLAQTKSSPANFQRKAQHKRTRSYDVTKTFKDDLQVLPPERSASHDNLAKLKENEPLNMPVLAVEFASPESPPQMEFKSLRAGDGGPECLARKNSVKHRSCNNIIDIEDEPGVQVSPKFSRTFKDSKLISASAFCLTNSVMKKASAAVRREAMPAALLQGEETFPALDSAPSLPCVGPGEAAHFVYISPYELTTHVRDKPTLQRLMGMFHVQTSVSASGARLGGGVGGGGRLLALRGRRRGRGCKPLAGHCVCVVSQRRRN